MLAALVGLLALFGFGGLLLILVFGVRRVEEERQARAEREARLAARQPRFLVIAPPRAEPRIRSGVDEGFLWQLEQYVQAEQLLADQFVLQPSIETLYRPSGRSLPH